MTDILELPKIGTICLIGEKYQTEAILIGINIRENKSINYKVSYWIDSDYKKEWIQRANFKLKKQNSETFSIGFS